MTKINVSKTNDDVNIEKNDGSYRTDEMTDKVVEFCQQLLMDSSKFTNKESEKTFYLIYNYIKEYNRILYSPISNICYECFKEYEEYGKVDRFGSFISNIEKVSSFSGTRKYQTKLQEAEKDGKDAEVKYLIDTAKAIIKIWDHANLAQQQYNVLKLTDDEYRKKVDKFIFPIKEKTRKEMDALSVKMNNISDEMNDLSKSMNSQLLSMVGIFTALAFLIFGGISSLDNIFSNTQLPLFKIMVTGSVWGLCILNLVFVFLFCVGKMTRLNFKSSQEEGVSIFQKYPIVWWSNFTILAIMLFSIWGYYITKENVDNWFDKLCQSNPVLATIAGMVLIVVVLGIVANRLLKETKYTKSD